MQFVKSGLVYIGPSAMFGTDHRLLVMNMEFPSSKRALKIHLSRRPHREARPMTDFKALMHSVELQIGLTQALDEKLMEFDKSDVNSTNESIVNAVKTSIDEVLPKVAQQEKHEPWEDNELKNLMIEASKARKKKFRRLREKIKKRRKKLKNAYFKRIADGINNAAEMRDAQKEFSLAKNYSALKKTSQTSISNNKLKIHFTNHFASRTIPTPPEIEHPENFPQLKDQLYEVKENPPDLTETEKCLKTFKNNRSGGTDKLRTEGLKYNSSGKLLAAIVFLLMQMWMCVQVPSQWLQASITCLFKKGSKVLASNYRGISIGANMSRILAKIITDRFSHAYENQLSENQFGFRKNRGTTDGIFVMKNITEKYGDTLIAVYVDLTAAYDHIPRDFLFKVLKLRTGATILVNILQKMYEGTTAVIRGMHKAFDVFVGCRQGGQESPCLFNYYFDFVLKVAALEIDAAFPEGWGISFDYSIPHLCSNRTQRQKGNLNGTEVIKWILYADDVVLFCKSIKEAEEVLTILHNTCKRFGLNISFTKTKTQVFNNNNLASKLSLISVDNQIIENVSEFTYLGQTITTDEEKCFTEHRRSRANAKFNELRKVLSDQDVNIKSRRKILESCVRSRLLFGIDAGIPNESKVKKLETCWFQMLRSMVKRGWRRRNVGQDVDPEDVDFSFVYSNNQIQHILRTTPLRDVIHQQHLRYIGHVCRSENSCLTKKILFAKAQRRNHRNPWLKYSSLLHVSVDQAKKATQSRRDFAELVQRCTNSPS